MYLNQILIPSYKRAKTCKTHLLLPEVIYCVLPFEEQAYKAEGYNVQVIPDSLAGNLSKIRNYIKETYLKDFGFMVDDDIEAFKRWNYRGGKFKCDKLNTEDVRELLETMYIVAKESGVKLVGMNIIADKGSYREYTPFSMTNFISASLMGFFPTDIKFDERIPLKEDYDICLQLMNKYRKVLRFNFVHMIKKDHGNIGGLADVRTTSYEKAQMNLFQAKWGKQIVQNDPKNVSDINPVIKVPIKGV